MSKGKIQIAFLQSLLDNSGMSKQLRDVVAARLAVLGRNPFEAARAGGLERSFINDLLEGRKKSVRGDKLDQLAKALDWTLDQLLTAQRGQTVLSDPLPEQSAKPLPEFFDSKNRIPVYASVEGGPGEMVVHNEPVDWAARPWYLKEVREGYAVIVVGESMVPAFEPGELAVVNPKAPLLRGKNAIFVKREHEGDFRATIKRLVRQTPTEWIVHQWNPPEGEPNEFKLSRTEWPEAYRVVGKYDGG